MQKAKTSRVRSYEYYCDLCGKEVWRDRSHNDDISDHMARCPLCGKDACDECQVCIPHIDSQGSEYICRDCAKQHADTLAKLQENANAAWTTEHALRSELYSHRTTTKEKK